MKKYFFDLRTMAVVAGLMFLLMHGEVVFGQEANNTDSKSDPALELRDQNLLKAEEKRKRKVLVNKNINPATTAIVLKSKKYFFILSSL